MANATFTKISGLTVSVDPTTVTKLTVGTNTNSTYIRYTAGGGLHVLGKMADVKAALVAAGSSTATEHYTPQFDDYFTFA